jgi:hypothetical protein
MSRRLQLAALAAAGLYCGSTNAAFQFYTDRLDFTDALAGLPATPAVLGFDDSAADTIIPSGGSLGGVTFTYAFTGGVQLAVESGFDTVSAPNSLGSDDGDGTLQDGDSLAFTFAPSIAFALSIISADPLEDDDLRLGVGANQVGLLATEVQQAFNDGGSEWFLGLISDGADFTQASLTADSFTGGTAFFY